MTSSLTKPQQERKICKKFLLGAIETLQQITKTYKCECGNEMEVTWVRGLKPTKVVECDKCGKTAQVITSRKDKNMPKMNQAKSQQEIKGWEKELKKKFNHPMHRETSSFTKEAIRLFIHHLLQADRKAIRKEIRGMKKYHEWASKRDNQIHDKTIDDVLDILNSL